MYMCAYMAGAKYKATGRQLPTHRAPFIGSHLAAKDVNATFISVCFKS